MIYNNFWKTSQLKKRKSVAERLPIVFDAIGYQSGGSDSRQDSRWAEVTVVRLERARWLRNRRLRGPQPASAATATYEPTWYSVRD